MSRDMQGAVEDRTGGFTSTFTRSTVEYPPTKNQKGKKTDVFIENYHSIPNNVAPFLNGDQAKKFAGWPSWHPGSQSHLVKAGSPVTLSVNGKDKKVVLVGPEMEIPGTLSMDTPIGEFIFNRPEGMTGEVDGQTVKIKKIHPPSIAPQFLGK